MKKIILLALAFMAITGGCRYKDGPLISFRTAENRLNGIWEVNSFKINGIDCTSVYQEKCGCEFSFNFDKDTQIRSFSLGKCKQGIDVIWGSYDFVEGSNKTKISTFLNTVAPNIDSITAIIYFGPIACPSSSQWKILKLKNDDMIFNCNFNNADYTIEFNKIKYF